MSTNTTGLRLIHASRAVLRKVRHALRRTLHIQKPEPRPEYEIVPLPAGIAPIEGQTLAGCAVASSRHPYRFTFVVRTNRPGDPDPICEVYVRDTYHLHKLTRPPRVVFDIGSHIGSFSVLIKQKFPEAEVYCFEPNPVNFELLRRNTASFTGVHLFNKALSYQSDVVFLDTPDSTGSGIVRPRAQAGQITQGLLKTADPVPFAITSTPLETITLEEVFADTGVQKVDLVKWDCEGGELDAFANMSDTSAARFGQMVGEYHMEQGGLDAFLKLASQRFPGHRFYGQDNPQENIGRFFGVLAS